MKNLTLIILTCISVSLFAQKTKTKGCGWYEYIQPPSNMALSQFKSYFVEPDLSSERISDIKSKCNLTGLTKTNNEVDADVIVKISVTRIAFQPHDYKKNETTTEKDGVKTTTVTHTYTGYGSYNVRYKIYSRANNELLYSTDYQGGKSINVSSRTSATDAYNKYKNQKQSAKNNYVGAGIIAINKKVNDVLCYLNKKQNIKVLEVKAKKFNYDDYNKGIEILATFLNDPNKETRTTEINNAIKFWETEIPNADLDSKKARINKKVLAGAHYNIGLAHFMLYNYEKAKVALIEAQKYDKSVSAQHRPLIKECEKQIPRKVNLK
jgi:hypothetical protein